MVLIAGLFVLGIYFVAGSVRATAIAPVEPQPDEGALKPGLAVNYYYNDYREASGGGNQIDAVFADVASEGKPDKGEPLPDLNYRRGEGQKVLTSKFPFFVGAHIQGFLRFAEPGLYTLTVISNDGVRFTLDDKMLHEDPDVHPDRESDPIEVSVARPGWVKLEIGYFQRKGSAALVLKWKGPKGGELAPVPAEFFAHLEDQ
jgi:hypothetical protein